MIDTGLPGVTLDGCDHVCVFYRGAPERDAVLSAFFGAGYAEGDKCLCIADDHDVTAVADRLDPERRRGPDQLTVLPATAYLTDGRFRPDQAYGRWDTLLSGYVTDGYRRVRASGELSWFLRQHRAGGDHGDHDGDDGHDGGIGEGAGPLLEYEVLCNRLVKRRPATIFCLYDLDLLDAGLLPGVLARHPAALARGVLFRAPRPLPDPEVPEPGGVGGHPWRIGTRPGGANDALLLANLLLAGARSPEEITSLLDGIGRAVLEPGADPGPEGQRFLRALAGLAAPHRRALELEAELAARPAGTALDAGAAELTRALLDGDVADPADAARAATRARALGLDLDRPMRAVVIRPASGGLSGSVHEDLAAADIRLVAGRAGEVAFLAGDDDALDSVLAGLGRPGRFVGVGRAHTGAAGPARSYAEARRAADFAAGLDRPVLRHEDLGLFSLLADDGDPDPLADLVAEWLGPLLAHDAGRRQTLLPTLAAYLDSGAAQQATADALGVHVSTLKYRLGRIGEVLGRDLSAPDVRFQLQVALAAHRTLSVLRSTASRPTGD